MGGAFGKNLQRRVEVERAIVRVRSSADREPSSVELAESTGYSARRVRQHRARMIVEGSWPWQVDQDDRSPSDPPTAETIEAMKRSIRAEKGHEVEP